MIISGVKKILIVACAQCPACGKPILIQDDNIDKTKYNVKCGCNEKLEIEIVEVLINNQKIIGLKD